MCWVRLGGAGVGAGAGGWWGPSEGGGRMVLGVPKNEFLDKAEGLGIETPTKLGAHRVGGWSEQRELLSSVGTSRGNFLKFGRHGRHEQGEPRLLQSRYRRERVPGRWPQVTVFVLVTIQPLL